METNLTIETNTDRICENFQLDEDAKVLSCQTARPVKTGEVCPDCLGRIDFKEVLKRNSSSKTG